MLMRSRLAEPRSNGSSAIVYPFDLFVSIRAGRTRFCDADAFEYFGSLRIEADFAPIAVAISSRPRCSNFGCALGGGVRREQASEQLVVGWPLWGRHKLTLNGAWLGVKALVAASRFPQLYAEFVFRRRSAASVSCDARRAEHEPRREDVRLTQNADAGTRAKSVDERKVEGCEPSNVRRCVIRWRNNFAGAGVVLSCCSQTVRERQKLAGFVQHPWQSRGPCPLESSPIPKSSSPTCFLLAVSPPA